MKADLTWMPGEGLMKPNEVIQLAPLLDRLKVGRYHIVLITICFIAMFVDGMDFVVVAITAPGILREWQLSPTLVGTIFGVANFGLLLGAFLFGKIGDSYGRRMGILICVLLFSLPTLITAFSTSYEQLLILRFIACLGIGGVLPNIIAYVSELMPKRFRAGSVTLVTIAYACGAVAIGTMAAIILPRGHWSQLFLVIGTFGCILAILIYFFLPESVRYLAIADPRSQELRRSLQRLAPDAVIPAQAQLILERDQADTKSSFSDLLRDHLSVLTPLLWVVLFCEGLTFAVVQNWVVILAQRGGLPAATGSWIFTVGSAVAILVILLQAKIIDGLGWIVPLFGTIVATLALAMLGIHDLPQTALISALILLMAFTAAPHNALFSLIGPVYPVAIRSNGVGFATASARIAQIIGPMAGGYLLTANLALGELGYILIVPYLATAALCLVLHRMGRRSSVVGIAESMKN